MQHSVGIECFHVYCACVRGLIFPNPEIGGLNAKPRGVSRTPETHRGNLHMPTNDIGPGVYAGSHLFGLPAHMHTINR
eukprot:9470874-Pyramimonas_sp.AAC.2